MKRKPIGLLVQQKMCETCIYRPDSSLDIKELERQVADKRMEGYFVKFRACHHATRSVCCRGFWDRHKDSFTLGQLAQRLNMVVFVSMNRFNPFKRMKKDAAKSALPDSRKRQDEKTVRRNKS